MCGGPGDRTGRGGRRRREGGGPNPLDLGRRASRGRRQTPFLLENGRPGAGQRRPPGPPSPAGDPKCELPPAPPSTAEPQVGTEEGPRGRPQTARRPGGAPGSGPTRHPRRPPGLARASMTDGRDEGKAAAEPTHLPAPGFLGSSRPPARLKRLHVRADDDADCVECAGRWGGGGGQQRAPGNRARQPISARGPARLPAPRRGGGARSGPWMKPRLPTHPPTGQCGLLGPAGAGCPWACHPLRLPRLLGPPPPHPPRGSSAPFSPRKVFQDGSHADALLHPCC